MQFCIAETWTLTKTEPQNKQVASGLVMEFTQKHTGDSNIHDYLLVQIWVKLKCFAPEGYFYLLGCGSWTYLQRLVQVPCSWRLYNLITISTSEQRKEPNAYKRRHAKT